MKRTHLIDPEINKESECSLGRGNGPGSCMPKEVLIKIKSNIEPVSKDDKKKDDKEILNKLKEATKCNSEKCVLEKSPLSSNDKHDLRKYFKPNGPAHTDDLLHNGNIDTVLSSFKISHPDFYHMNFQMIDFNGIKDGDRWLVRNNVEFTPTELGKIDILDIIKQGAKTFGVVLNTDTRDKGGEHWFCIFCDFRQCPYTVEYFNSSGNKAYPEIQDWMNKTCAILKNTKCSVIKVSSDGMMHQRDSETECGPYSLYYIYNRLCGVPHTLFKNTRITDAAMLRFRTSLFTNKR